MKRHLPVKDNPGLFRDATSGAIINMDTHAFSEYKRKMNETKRKRLEEKQKEQEINTLKKDVAQMKSLLQQILEKLNNGAD